MKIEQIKENSLIKIEISTVFYQRLQHSILYQQSSFTAEELSAAHEKFSTDKELDEREEVLQTALILFNTIEAEAKEQGLVESVDVPESTVE